MRTVKLVIAFDGTRYEGWQSQRKKNTVQEILEACLKKILGHSVDLISSSRTDSGVHAAGMAAHFKTESYLKDDAIRRALNFYLPKDIAVRSAKTVAPSFHARLGAKSKVYVYQIHCSDVKPVFDAPYVLWCPYKLDIALMGEAARRMVGRHDFRSFYDRDGEAPQSFVRTIKCLSVIRRGDRVTIRVEGDGFLRHMVRVIVGTLIQVGRGRISPDKVKFIIASKSRKNAGPTARAQGLTLLKVNY